MDNLIPNCSSFKCSKGTARTLLVVAFVYGIQELLRVQFFRCPCTNHELYSFTMLAAPSVFLLGVGFSSSDSYWRTVFRRKHIKNYKLKLNYCLKSLPSLFQPFLPAVSFVVFALMRGEYYACAKAGGQHLACVTEHGLEPNVITSKTTPQEIAKFNTQSQLLGCGILAGVTIFAVGIIFIRNCCFESDVLPDNEEFRLIENQILFAAFREKLKEVIESEVKRDVEEAFEGRNQRDAESVFRQARDLIEGKKSLTNKVGRFSRLTFNEDGHSSPRIVDSSF